MPLTRILVAHNSYQQAGGEDAVVEQETALLRREGHEVLEYRRSNDEINKLGVWEKLTLPRRIIWACDTRQDLKKLTVRERPDVVHFHNTFFVMSPAAYWGCREIGVPVVQTLHNYRLVCPAATFFRDGHVCEDCLGRTPPWPGVAHGCYRESRSQTAVVATMLTMHRWLKTWQEQVDIYIALTEFSRSKFIQGGLPEEKIVVKPNFLHPDPGMRQAMGDYALFVGRLSAEKGVRMLLRSWDNLRSIPLKVVGDGPLLDEMASFVQTHRLEAVDLLGRLPHHEILTLMKGARFLVLPSEWYEGFPMTLTEAFACGVPVIVSRLGAMTQIVEDGRTGLQFAPSDPEDLAAKVEWAWTHPEQMEVMGREARTEYEAKYTADRNYRMLTDIYQRAIHAADQAEKSLR